MGPEAKHPVQTTHKSLDIVEALAEMESAGVTELAEELGMSKSIVHNHLSTLEERGYAVGEDGEYRLTLRFLEIGGLVRNRLKLYHDGRPEIKKLASKTGEVANLATEEQGQCVYLFQDRGDQAVKLEINYEGSYEYLHSTAIGKAILAYLPDERVESIVNRYGLEGQTEQTITDREALWEELERVRERGFAVDDEESIPGLRCVAAPIRIHDGHVLGAVSVSGPISRFKGTRWEEEIPELVQNTANVIEINAQYSRT